MDNTPFSNLNVTNYYSFYTYDRAFIALQTHNSEIICKIYELVIYDFVFFESIKYHKYTQDKNWFYVSNSTNKFH